jgi:acetyl esterase/lipase
LTPSRIAVPVAYGPAPSQVAELYLPVGTDPCPVVVMIHGGLWTVLYDRAHTLQLARDLADRGYAVWNIEYRRIGEDGGGWPGTFDDVATAIDALADLAAGRAPQGEMAVSVARDRLDLGRVITMGHSAGGHLALWAAARPGLPAGSPGSQPRVPVSAAISLAGITDLAAADGAALHAGFPDLGPNVVREAVLSDTFYLPTRLESLPQVAALCEGGVAAAFLGGHRADVPDRYELASPIARLPIGTRQLLVHGDQDGSVPVTQSRSYADAARVAGDAIDYLELAGVGHTEVLDVAGTVWASVVERLAVLASG